MRPHKPWILLGVIMVLSLLSSACAPASIPVPAPVPIPPATPTPTPTLAPVPIPPATPTPIVAPPSLEKEEYPRVYPETLRGFWMPSLANLPRGGKQALSVDEPETIKEFHANLVAFAAHVGYDHEGKIYVSRIERQLPLVRSLIKEYHQNNISVFLTIEVLGPERSQNGGPLPIPESVSRNDEFISGYDRCLEKVVSLAEEEKVEYFATMNEPDYKLGGEIGNVWSRRMLQIVQKGFTGKIVYKGALYPIHWGGKQLDVSGYSYVGLTSAPFNGKLEEYRPSLSERLQTLIEWSREDKFELMITEFGVSGLGQNTTEEKKAEALTTVFEEGRKYGIRTYIVSDLRSANIKGTALEQTVKKYFLRLEQSES